MEELLVLILVLILASAVAPVVYATRKRIGMPAGRLEFWQVLNRRGLTAADAAAEPRRLAIALRRCALCPSVEQCNRWLELGARERLEDFCPNAVYVKELERS